MRSVSVRLADLNKVTIPIGFVGENLHTQVRIDCVKLFEEYPNAVPTLTVNPPMGDTYPAIVTRDGDYIIWEVEDSDLIYNGNGEIQLTFFVDEVVAKSYISRIRIEKSLVPTGEVPTPIENWIDEANEKLAEVEQWNNVTAEATTLAPGTSATVEITEENGHNKFEFGIPRGDKGDTGTPGFSPVIVVTDITGGHRVSITDVGGTQTVDIMDGEKGDTGNGIESAVLNQDYTLTLNFTDGTHYTTPSIRGAKGETGDTGNGIASVTLNQDYTLTITYTNGQSTTTASIRGEKGETGATPIIAIGTVTTLSPGSDATASMDVTDPEHPVLSFGIPEGEPGEVTEAELSAVADSKADVITDTASGAIASFPDGANGMPVKSLVVNVDPVQDLHGYDNPWPAGGGSNIWDEQLELGGIDSSNGSAYSSTTAIRSKNYIPVTPGTTYYLKSSSENCTRCWYDENKQYISTGYSVNLSITAPNNAHFFRFGLPSGYGTTYKNDVALNYPSTVTTYFPYSNICPISGWTGAVVNRTGNNLIYPKYESRTQNNVTFTVNSDRTITTTTDGTASGTAYAAPNLSNDPSKMQLIPAGTYKLTGGVNNSERVYLGGKYIDNSSLPSGYDSGSGVTYTLTKPAYVYPQIVISSGIASNRTFNIQLELGSTASDYTPYVGNVYPISWQTEAGTVYGGTLDVTSGVLRVTPFTLTANGTQTLNSPSNGSYDKTYSTDRYITVTGMKSYSSSDNKPVWSSALKLVKGGIWTDDSENSYNAFNITSNQVHMNFKNTVIGITASDDRATRTSKIAAWLEDNPITFVLPLAEPIEVQLTETEISTLLGQNNVWADCGDTSVEYCADTRLYIEKLTKPTEDDMIANSNIPSGTFFMVGNSLFLSTQAIAQGATITPGTNCTAISLADALNTISQ